MKSEGGYVAYGCSGLIRDGAKRRFMRLRINESTNANHGKI